MGGYSGTGKTHTVLDGEDSLVSCVAQEIMKWRDDRIQAGCQPGIRCSIVEVYKNNVWDLLRGREQTPLANGGKGILPEVCFHEVTTTDQLIGYFTTASEARMTDETINNTKPSRGHLVATITLSHDTAGKSSTFFVADLAGAERPIRDDMTGLSKQRQAKIEEECQNINSELTNIYALAKEVCAGQDRRPTARHGSKVGVLIIHQAPSTMPPY